MQGLDLGEESFICYYMYFTHCDEFCAKSFNWNILVNIDIFKLDLNIYISF